MAVTGEIRGTPIQGVVASSAIDYKTALHAAVSATYPAIANGVHYITGVAWSYSGAPGAGALVKIEDGIVGSGNIIYSADIVAAGPGSVNFIPPRVGSLNTQMSVTLTDGGAGVTGKLTVLGHFTG